MNMASLIPPSSITRLNPTRNWVFLSPYHHHYLRYPIGHKSGNTHFQLQASVPPMNAEYLESEFGGRGNGVTFEGIAESCVVRMQLENGSMASLMLPSGLITSYKAPMWHGGKLELLQTAVSEGDGAGAVIRGGVSVALSCQFEQEGESWSPSAWALNQVSGTSSQSLQVELISRSQEKMVEVKHIVSLQQDQLSSEILLSNLQSSSSLHLMGSIVSHLTVSTPEATYAVGLEGSTFFNKPPFLSNFSIIPPDITQKKALLRWGLPQFLFGRDQNDDGEDGEEIEEETEGEESDNYKHLTEKMSKIYLDSPRNFTLIDRGRRNSIVVGREGFKEMYMYSPGSAHEWYSKYAYICIGQSALLQPVVVAPQCTWRGLQHLQNPNT